MAYKKLDAALLDRLRAAGFRDLRAAHGDRREGSRVGEMAENAGMAQQSMSELVDSLERLGYAERRAGPRDRRARIVAFTEHGWAAVRAGAAAIDDLERDWSSRIGARGTAAMRASLEQIATERGAP